MEKKSNKSEHLLTICLESLEQEGETIDSIISRFPGNTDTLRAELEAAVWLKSEGKALDPRQGFIDSSKHQLVGRILQHGKQSSSRWRWSNLWFDVSTARRNRFAVQFLLLLLLVVSLFYSGKNLLRASDTWLPGDVTYPLKRLMEQTTLLLTPSMEGKARLHIEYTQNRLLEVQALFFENRYDEVPSTVVNFTDHLVGAVQAVNNIAMTDPTTAKALAAELQNTLSGQIQLTYLMAGFMPSPTSIQYIRVGNISQDGLEAMQNVLSRGSG